MQPETGEAESRDADFLRKRMIEELSQADACLGFYVQVQDSEKYMPIEDPSIEWKESDVPYTRIATITIPSQEFDSKAQREFCENLSFNPWHTRPEHRPVGQLNRIRKLVYESSALFRFKTNESAPPASLDW